jgi:hypothetical protein
VKILQLLPAEPGFMAHIVSGKSRTNENTWDTPVLMWALVETDDGTQIEPVFLDEGSFIDPICASEWVRRVNDDTPGDYWVFVRPCAK